MDEKVNMANEPEREIDHLLIKARNILGNLETTVHSLNLMLDRIRLPEPTKIDNVYHKEYPEQSFARFASTLEGIDQYTQTIGIQINELERYI